MLNWNLNPKVRFALRILAILVGLFFIFMGALALIDRISRPNFRFDSTVKFAIAAIGWGIVILVVVIRGRLFLSK